MKLVYTGGMRRLFPIWGTLKKVIERDYPKEYKNNEIILTFDYKSTLTLETTNPELAKDMRDEFKSKKGWLVRHTTPGVKIELKE
jgi:hypothetical protein